MTPTDDIDATEPSELVYTPNNSWAPIVTAAGVALLLVGFFKGWFVILVGVFFLLRTALETRRRAEIERSVTNVRDATDWGNKLVQKLYTNPFVLSPFYKPSNDDLRVQTKLLGDVEDWIVDVPLGEQLVAGRFDDFRPRIEVLVDAMAEPHQLEIAVLVLGHVNVFLDVAAVLEDAL